MRLQGTGDFGTHTPVTAYADGTTIEDVAIQATLFGGAPAIRTHAGTTLDRVDVAVFDGPALSTAGSQEVTVRDSRLALVAIDPVFDRPAIEATAEADLTLLRTAVHAPEASYAAIDSRAGLLADSTVVVGGWRAALLHRGGVGDAVLRGVTVDAGVSGIVDVEPAIPFAAEPPASVVEEEDDEIVLRSSIALERAQALDPGARVTCSFSSAPAQVQSPDAGASTGALACGAAGGNQPAADPGTLFRDALFRDYRLRSSSPGIDAGDPAPLGAGESPIDRAGSPRVAQPAAGCANPARRDQGAYEAEARCLPPGPGPGGGDPDGNPGGGNPGGGTSGGAPGDGTPGGGSAGGGSAGGPSDTTARDTTAPRLAALRLRGRATRRRLPSLRLRLDEQATVRVRILRGRRGVAAGSARLTPGTRTLQLRRLLRRRGLRPGSYRLEITATDAAGNRAAPRRLRLRAR